MCDKRQNEEGELQIVASRCLNGILLSQATFMEIVFTRGYITKMSVPIVTLMIVSVILMAEGAQEKGVTKGRHVLIAAIISGNNTYMAWPDNNTGHWNVFFAKSTDGGKTFKTTLISAPNKGNTTDQNTEIYALGSKVSVSWWTNKTGGALTKVYRESNDNGNTFGPISELNSTSYHYCVNLKQCRPS